MNRTPVTSSNVASIGWDAGTAVLEVEFHNGRVYQYEQVPQSVFSGLMRAGSHGGYLTEHVKGVYPYQQIN
jgi:hypothetical protein